MSKRNNRGFLLAESLIVSTFVLTVITLIFIQFKNLMVNNKRHYSYNSIENIYNLGSLAEYLKANENESNSLNNALSISPNYYYTVFDGNSCSDFVLNPGMQSGCTNLAKDMDLKYVFYTDSNVENVKNNIDNIDQDMLDFIEKVDSTQINGKGRLFAKFNDGSFATIAMDQKEIARVLNRTVYYSLGLGNDMNWWSKLNGSTTTITYDSNTRINHIVVLSRPGWEQFYIPFETEPGVTYNLIFQYNMGSFSYHYPQHQGVACQILSENNDADAFDDDVNDVDHLSEGDRLRSMIYLSSGTNGTATVNFIANANLTYLIFNFGYAADNQTVNADIGDFKLVKNIGSASTYGNMAIPQITNLSFKGWKNSINGDGVEIKSDSAVSPSLFTKNPESGMDEQTVAATYN